MNYSHLHNNLSDEICQAFSDLFKGRTDAWGSVEGRCNKEPVTPEHYSRHLKGKESLGIYPLLDDGTCYFFALDIDEKDFNKAKAIRQELLNNNIPVYIAESKSKGYHIYGFALEKFSTKEIRKILHYVLNKLGIKAEIFPKQDKVDAITPYGNYINLPCFGYTRQFLAMDLRNVPLEILINKVKYTPQESIERLLKTISEEPPKKKVRKQKWTHKDDPPCIKAILKGVDHGKRDESAFALARYYLKELDYEVEEVLEKLVDWDTHNAPPLGDYTIKVKVKSAEKGYGFGCGSIKGEDVLSNLCVGEEKCEWLEELRSRYLIKDKGTVKVNKKALVDDLTNEFIFKTIYGIARDDILIYQDGVYTQEGENVIREECEKRVGAPILTTHTAHEIRDRIAGITRSDRDWFNTEKYIINLENGLLDVRTRELRPHTPEFLSTMRIPIFYNPQAKCPKIEKFLTEVVPKHKGVILEFFGYALIPDYSIATILILVGSGSNGKSQLYTILKQFIGEANCCSISLRNIKDYAFTLADLYGKLLNIQGDLSGGWFQDMNTLKMLSGQDRVSAPRKYKDTIYFDNFARLTFATNDPPKIEEDTLAVWRRILMVDCPNEFRPGQEGFVRDIGNVISTPKELSGLLNLALDGLQRVLNNNDFTYEGTYEDRARRYTLRSDPVRLFVDECCDTGPDFKILKKELYDAYVVFCNKNKVQLKGDAQFGKDLRQVPGLSIGDKQYQEAGERVRWWLGIKLRPEPEPSDIDMEV